MIFFFLFLTAFTEDRLGLSLPAIIFPPVFSSQSNWYDMNAGNFNLLLIKTCCWHWLHTEGNPGHSCSQFSSSPSVVLLSSLQLYLPFIPLYFFVLPFTRLFSFLYDSPTTMKRKREPSGEKSSSSTTTSWRRRSPSISSERTTWVSTTAWSGTGCHKSELSQCEETSSDAFRPGN